MLLDHPARDRIAGEPVVWLTTVSPSGRPQSSPVWFLVEGDEVLVYSRRSARVHNLRANPNVALNLNSDKWATEVVSMEGAARIDETAPPADRNPRYVNKYRERMAANGWTPEQFASLYPVPIRIRLGRIRA